MDPWGTSNSNGSALEVVWACILDFHHLTGIYQVALEPFVCRSRNSNFPKFG